MCWVRHIVFIDDQRLLKCMFYGKPHYKRPQHKLKKFYRENIKNIHKPLKIDTQGWEKLH